MTSWSAPFVQLSCVAVGFGIAATQSILCQRLTKTTVTNSGVTLLMSDKLMNVITTFVMCAHHKILILKQVMSKSAKYLHTAKLK